MSASEKSVMSFFAQLGFSAAFFAVTRTAKRKVKTTNDLSECIFLIGQVGWLGNQILKGQVNNIFVNGDRHDATMTML